MNTLQRIECKWNSSFCDETACKVTYQSRDRSFMNFGCNFIKKVDKLNFHLVLYFRTQTYKKFLVDIDEDYCGYFNGKKSKILKYFLPNLMKYAPGFDFHCPLTGNFSAMNLPYTSFRIPQLLPDGQYRLNVDLKNKNFMFLSMKIYFTVKEIDWY